MIFSTRVFWRDKVTIRNIWEWELSKEAWIIDLLNIMKNLTVFIFY